MEELTAAERAAIKRALLAFKRFWHAGRISVQAEEDAAEALIDAGFELAKAMEEKE